MTRTGLSDGLPIVELELLAVHIKHPPLLLNRCIGLPQGEQGLPAYAVGKQLKRTRTCPAFRWRWPCLRWNDDGARKDVGKRQHLETANV